VHALEPSKTTMKTIELIAAEIGEGAQEMGCKDGPAALRTRGLSAALTRAGRTAIWGAVVQSDAHRLAFGQMSVVAEFSPRLAQATQRAASLGNLPVILGGDHSCAVGTWSGIAQAHHARGDLGLIWIDAHLDSHTPDTSESGAPHGMPLAALLGHGPAGLADMYGWRGKFKPEHVVVIGARSFEAGEIALLQALDVRVMDIHEVQRRGFAACMAEAIDLVGQDTVGYGVTFDIDALDPQDAPGVGSPVENGVRLAQAVQGLAMTAGDPRLVGFELVEYNPLLDDAQGTTAQACEALLQATLVATEESLDQAAALAA
jgi:arginase